jgi:two-component system sensor histidine kinase/response regulator
MHKVSFRPISSWARRASVQVLSNAIKFTDSGGEIIVTATTHPDEDGTGTILKVSCKDNGRGIRPSDLQRLFSRFEQVEQSDRKQKQQGTGLGLSIIKQLSELMGGTCGLFSEGLGKGSECWFTVRLEPAPSSKPGLTASVPLKILVVEPRASIRKILMRYLEGWGHTCSACGTIAEARQLARSAEAALGAWPFQAVVIDCKVVLKSGGMAFVDKVLGKGAGVVLLSPVEIEASLDMSKFAAVATKPLQVRCAASGNVLL